MRRFRVPTPLTTAHGPASDRLRDKLDQLMSAGAISGSLRDDLDEVARMAVREVLLRALEAEIGEFLGTTWKRPDSVLETDEPEGTTPLAPIQVVNADHPEPHRNGDWCRPEERVDEAGVRSGVNTLKAVMEALSAVR